MTSSCPVPWVVLTVRVEGLVVPVDSLSLLRLLTRAITPKTATATMMG